jgi:RNA polymerase sigma-70 factor, ECF subfamily
MPMFSRRGRAPQLAVVKDEPAAPPSTTERALGHVDELYGLARHLCGNASDAEDLVQDTYARALAGAARFEDGTNLRAWLFRILRNAFIDQARRRNIVLELPDEDIETRALDTAAIDPLRYLDAAQVARAIGELPVELRFTLLLDLEGFSEADTADILKIAPGTVKSRLARAKGRLRAMLAGGPR